MNILGKSTQARGTESPEASSLGTRGAVGGQSGHRARSRGPTWALAGT